jgi:hypothetical protein
MSVTNTNKPGSEPLLSSQQAPTPNETILQKLPYNRLSLALALSPSLSFAGFFTYMAVITPANEKNYQITFSCIAAVFYAIPLVPVVHFAYDTIKLLLRNDNREQSRAFIAPV